MAWLADLVGYPADTAGGDLTSGGSIGNLSAIVTAREAHGIRSADLPKRVIYLTAQTHHSVHKALRIAGLDECVQRTVAVDRCGRMDVGISTVAWRRTRKRADSVARRRHGRHHGRRRHRSARAIAALCEQQGLWLHVDAAYGGAFLLCERDGGRWPESNGRTPP